MTESDEVDIGRSLWEFDECDCEVDTGRNPWELDEVKTVESVFGECDCENATDSNPGKLDDFVTAVAGFSFHGDGQRVQIGISHIGIVASTASCRSEHRR